MKLAIIPARSNSRGIPRKNVRPLVGHPLIAHTIKAARESRIDRIIVSTEDEDIATVSKLYGAEVIMRPKELSNDDVSSEEVLLHVLRKEKPKLTIMLQCTSPLTTAEDIDGIIQLLIDEKADTAFTARRFHGFLWQDGRGINHDKSVRLLRQQMKPQYLETGAVYAMRTKGFLKHKHRFFGKTVMYETGYNVDIDSEIDFRIAEALMKWKKAT